MIISDLPNMLQGGHNIPAIEKQAFGMPQPFCNHFACRRVHSFTAGDEKREDRGVQNARVGLNFGDLVGDYLHLSAYKRPGDGTPRKRV